MEKVRRCPHPECGGEMAEFCLVVFSGTWGHKGKVKEKGVIGFYCPKCHHFEFDGIPTPEGKEYFLVVKSS